MRYFIFLFFFALPVWADQLIIEPDMGRQPIITAMENAKHSVFLTMYGFTDPELLQTLLAQQAAGKTVKILLEPSPYKAANENTKVIAAFNQQDVNWKTTPASFKLLHQKTLLTDEQQAIVMTFNFTRSTFNKDARKKPERNFGLIIDDARTVKQISALFAADWNRVPYVNQDDQLIVSPDDSRQKIMTLLAGAKKSIRIYAQQINDYHIVGAFAKAAKKGVSVEILTSSRMREKQEAYLQKAGVRIRYTDRQIIHAKVIMIDEALAVIGSINLTKASLDHNRELSVVTRDARVLKPLQATFQEDWKAAQSLFDHQTTVTLTRQVISHVRRQIRNYS